MKLQPKDIINIDDCKALQDKYQSLKVKSLIDPQPDASSQTRISNCVNDQLIRYPFKSLSTYKLVNAIIRYTWGYRGLAENQGYTKYAVSIGETKLMEICNISKNQLIASIKEAELANILIIKHHKGARTADGGYLTNYYMFNKHYDTWMNRYGEPVDSSIVDSSIVDSSIVDSSIVDSSIVDSSIVDSSIVDSTTDTEKIVDEAKDSPTSTDKDLSENKKKNPKDSKSVYQEAVLLTDDEYAKLVDRFGKDDADRRIYKLSMYILSKGDKYKSHYHTILKWENDDKEKQANAPKKLTGHAGMRTE
jgi:hypothetical protein